MVKVIWCYVDSLTVFTKESGYVECRETGEECFWYDEYCI